MTTRAQRRADRVFERAFGRWLDRIATSERLSRQVHDRIARRIARELRGASAAEVAKKIERVFAAFEADRLRIIERAVFEAAELGTGMTAATARAVFGRRAGRAARATVDDQRTLARRIARKRLNGDAAVDGAAMRTRLRTRTKSVVAAMADQVRDSLRLGETTTETSLRLLRTTDVEVRIPRYIQDIRDAVKGAKPSAVRRAVRAQLARLEDGRIQEHNIAAETRRFLERVDRSKGADIDAAVEQWVRGRAENQCMTIARTEGQAALAETYVESTGEQPWVVGYKWNLSPAHSDPDVCDILANQDLYGLGPGGYPVGRVPPLPAHPNDLCYLTAIIDENHLDRELAKERGKPEPPRPWETEGGVSGRDWLAKQPREMREKILGAGRAREFERSPGKVVNADGSLNPLWKVQGRRPPPPPAGERFIHRASGRVERRRRMRG